MFFLLRKPCQSQLVSNNNVNLTASVLGSASITLIEPYYDGWGFLSKLKAMLHEAMFLATCNATDVALQVARKNSRVTPHFATAIVALRVARKVERPSTFRNVARQVACV